MFTYYTLLGKRRFQKQQLFLSSRYIDSRIFLNIDLQFLRYIVQALLDWGHGTIFIQGGPNK